MLNKILELTRPLAVLDLETTGLQAKKDRIIQIGITMHYHHKDPIVWSTLVNPEIPIPKGIGHAITDEDVKDAPKFRDLALDISTQLLDVDIAGHNVAGFDINFLKEEMLRAEIPWPWTGHVIDTLTICRLVNPHTLSNAYKHFVDPAGFERAHDAANDVAATIAVLHGQLTKHPELPRTVKELAEFCSNRPLGAIDSKGKIAWVNDQPCLTFGKWKDTPLQRVDKGYFVWMINSDNFSDEVVVIIGNALKGEFPTK